MGQQRGTEEKQLAPSHNEARRHPLCRFLITVVFVPVGLVYNFLRDNLFNDVYARGIGCVQDSDENNFTFQSNDSCRTTRLAWCSTNK